LTLGTSRQKDNMEGLSPHNQLRCIPNQEGGTNHVCLRIDGWQIIAAHQNCWIDRAERKFWFRWL
jgi:hypothetical protein